MTRADVIAGALLAGAVCLASLVAYLAFWWDKRAARRGRRRVPEKTLLLLCAAGGWPGGLLAIRTLRHKTRKGWFLAGVWASAALSLVLLAGAVWAWVTFGRE